MVESRLVPVSEARTVCWKLVTNRVRHQRSLRTCLLQNQDTANTSCNVLGRAQTGQAQKILTNAGVHWDQVDPNTFPFRFPVDVGLRHDLRVLKTRAKQELFSAIISQIPNSLYMEAGELDFC